MSKNLWLAGVIGLSLCGAANGQVTFNLDGSAAPDPSGSGPGTWDHFNIFPGSSYFGPSSGGAGGTVGGNNAPRGYNDVAPFTAGDTFDTRPDEEAQSELTPAGNQALFMSMNNRSGQGGNKNDFQFDAGGDVSDYTLSARFKVDWANNAFNGIGILALQPKFGPGIALAISDFGQDDLYEIALIQYRGGPMGTQPTLFATALDPDSSTAQETAGYWVAQLYADPVTDTATFRLVDETTGAVHEPLAPLNLAEVALGTNASFGAGLNELTRGNGGELKMVFDYVTLQSGNAIPEPASLSLVGLGLAGLALRRRAR